MTENKIQHQTEYLKIDTLHTKDLRRLFSKIHIDQATECWIWIAFRYQGYGRTIWRGKVISVHRLMYAWLVAPIPVGFAARKIAQLDHLCKNRACCNPLHLELVSQKTNILRSSAPSASYAKRTHCPKGHEFTPENTYRFKRGERICKVCQREHGRKMYQQNRENVIARTSANQRRRKAQQKLLRY